MSDTYLLPGEDVLVEVKLELFISNVDAELLKWVAAEVLKAKDIQDSHVPQLGGPYSQKRREEGKHENRPLRTMQEYSLAHSSPVSRRVKKWVDPVDDPAEQPSIQGLGHSITDVHCLFQCIETNNGLSMCYHTGGSDGLLKHLNLDLKEVSNCKRNKYNMEYTLL